jgi:hypothetical protein
MASYRKNVKPPTASLGPSMILKEFPLLVDLTLCLSSDYPLFAKLAPPDKAAPGVLQAIRRPSGREVFSW